MLRRVFRIAVVGSFALASGVTHADPVAAPDAPDASDGAEIESVIVTARRRSN